MKPGEDMEEEEYLDEQALQRKRQDLKRQIIRKVDKLDDLVLLEAIMELIDDAENDYMEAQKDPELAQAAELGDEHPENPRRPAPINKRFSNDADSWLAGLGR